MNFVKFKATTGIEMTKEAMEADSKDILVDQLLERAKARILKQLDSSGFLDKPKKFKGIMIIELKEID